LQKRLAVKHPVSSLFCQMLVLPFIIHSPNDAQYDTILSYWFFNPFTVGRYTE